MIVSDDTVHKALQYLSQDPHPIALATKDLRDAENAFDIWFAAEYSHVYGDTIKEREGAVTINPGFKNLKDGIAAAEMELVRHKARVKAADMLIECWRSEQANVRAAEKVR